jgi:hypothetical protein
MSSFEEVKTSDKLTKIDRGMYFKENRYRECVIDRGGNSI